MFRRAAWCMSCAIILSIPPSAHGQGAPATPPVPELSSLAPLLPDGPGAMAIPADNLLWVFEGPRRLEVEMSSGRVLSDVSLQGLAGWPDELESVRSATNLDARTLLLVDQWLDRDGALATMAFIQNMEDSTSYPVTDALAEAIGSVSVDAMAVIYEDLYLFSGDQVHVFGFEEQAIIDSAPITSWPGWPTSWASGISTVLALDDGRVCYFRGTDYAWVTPEGLGSIRSISSGH